jgi:acyl-CoA thioester hydrolase
VLTLFEPGGEAAWLASFRFSVDVRPRYCECDGLGHVSNTVYPEYLEFGRLQHLIAAGDPEPSPFAFAHVTAEFSVRYLAPCFYDEPLRIGSKLVALGRSSATMEQAITGPADSLRAIARVTFVRIDGDATIAWTSTQRAALELFEGRALSG